ncbi:hypothetical protein [Flavobacterium sangjuense]|uniref:Uncharacterized protein n=1 Tax=Flavobacterium sangjuense TaxID=2518177 RepID=A0A4P7PUD7_9FLAO|nr:hypothetical protein [Flavobacterium sangjuense]QBZ98539.1 hypothetical protein GS03_02047 [Flavobacterium sangjuense]
MKEKILTYAVISFVLLNIWSLYLFFDYFTEKDEIIHSLGLFLNFVYTAVAAVVLGGLLLLIRLIFHFRKKANPVEANFFYILSGIFNANIFIIWLISLSLHILEIGTGRLQVCAFFSLLLAIIILSDTYKSYKKR